MSVFLPKHIREAMKSADDIRLVPAPRGFGIMHALWAVSGEGVLIVAPGAAHAAIRRVCLSGCIVQTALAPPPQPQRAVHRVIIDLRDVARGTATWKNLARVVDGARVLLLTDGDVGGRLMNGEEHG